MRVKFTDSKGQARVEEMVVLGGTTTASGSAAGLVVAEVTTPIGVWTSKIYNTANGNGEASGTLQSLSLPQNLIALKIQFSDLASSSLTKLGVSIGANNVTEAEASIAALFAGTISGSHQIGINDEFESEFTANLAVTLLAWRSTATDTGTNEVIISYKVAI